MVGLEDTGPVATLARGAYGACGFQLWIPITVAALCGKADVGEWVVVVVIGAVAQSFLHTQLGS